METFQSIRTSYLEATSAWGRNRPKAIVNTSRRTEMCEHLEISEDGTFSLVYFEKGAVYNNRETMFLDELFYWMAVEEARSYATNYEYHHQQPKLDTRRIIFSSAEFYLAKVSQKWSEKLHHEHEEELLRYPYQDFPSPYCRYRGKPLFSKISHSYSIAGKTL